MKSSWQNDRGHLVCRWFEAGPRTQYNPPWIQDAANARGSYLPPVPDFAAHSPFGGATWFDRYRSPRNLE